MSLEVNVDTLTDEKIHQANLDAGRFTYIQYWMTLGFPFYRDMTDKQRLDIMSCAREAVKETQRTCDMRLCRNCLIRKTAFIAYYHENIGDTQGGREYCTRCGAFQMYVPHNWDSDLYQFLQEPQPEFEPSTAWKSFKTIVARIVCCRLC